MPQKIPDIRPVTNLIGLLLSLNFNNCVIPSITKGIPILCEGNDTKILGLVKLNPCFSRENTKLK